MRSNILIHRFFGRTKNKIKMFKKNKLFFVGFEKKG